MTQKITRLNPPALPDSSGMGYSQITIAEPGRMAYISGQVALDVNEEAIPTDMVGQAKLAVKNAAIALDHIGATVHDIVMMRIYVTGLTPERLEEVWPHILEFLDGAQPSLTGVGVEALASPAFKLEIEMTARVPD